MSPQKINSKKIIYPIIHKKKLKLILKFRFENEYLALNTKIDNVCITAIIIHNCFGLIYLQTQRFIISTNYSFERRCKMHISLTPEL